jgi:hypothetical protein
MNLRRSKPEMIPVASLGNGFLDKTVDHGTSAAGLPFAATKVY